MQSAPLPSDESARVRALHEYGVLDQPAPTIHDDLVALAVQSTGFAMAAISLVDSHRQWFLSRLGIEASELPREASFCAHAILTVAPLEVEDARLDPRFHDNPFVVAPPGLRAYVGVPLCTSEGYRIGTLCVLDPQPRVLSEDQRRSLITIARAVTAELEARRSTAATPSASQLVRQLANVAAKTANPVLMIDQDRRVTWVNDAFTLVTGHAREAVLGREVAGVLGYEAMNAGTLTGVRAAMQRREPVKTTLQIPLATSGSIWVSLDIQPAHEIDGTFAGFTIVATDVTSRVRVQAQQAREIEVRSALLRAQQRLLNGDSYLAGMTEALQALALLTHSDHARLFEVLRDPQGVPLGLRAVLSATRAQAMVEEAVVIDWADVDDASRAACLERVPVRVEPLPTAACVHAGIAPGAPGLTVPLGGGRHSVALLCLVNPTPQEEPLGQLEALTPLTAFLCDTITAERHHALQEQARQALLRERHRLHLALDAGEIGVFECDVDSDEVTWDARCWTMHDERPRPHWSIDEWLALVHADDVAATAEALRCRCEPTGAARALVYRVAHHDGTVRTVSLHVQATHVPGRHLLVGTLRDVSREMRAKEELEAARARAEAAARTEAQFLATMSHEIRTPMNGVLGMLDLLRRAPLAAEHHECVELAHGAAEALLGILNDVLDHAKLEAGQVLLESVPYSLQTVIEEVLTLHGVSARDKGLSLRSEHQPDMPASIGGDPNRVRQVLLNLVGNAIKFTQAGSVTVSARYDWQAHRIRVEVRDTGVGVPPAVQARLFERFVQADASTSRQFGGTGLGLAICRQLVTIMDGRIGVSSAEGEGSTFWFELPASPSAARPGMPDGPLPFDTPMARLRVLGVDDNVVNQRVLLAYLKRLGHLGVVVGSGEAALATLSTRRFDVVLMDIQMPAMDGMECVSRIRASGEPWRDTSVIALTANAMPGDRERYLSLGFDGYVPKPLTLDALSACLRATSDAGSRRLDA